MNYEKSLDVQLEKAIKSSLISKRTSKELINEALRFPNLNSFFNQFSRFPIYKRLLFLHRFDLFGIEDEMQRPYLHLCNPKIEERESIESGSTALHHIVASELGAVNNYKSIWESMLGIDDKKRDEVSEDFKDILAYYVIRFIRSNTNIKTLVNADDFDYHKMKELLKNYDGTIDLENEEEIDPTIKAKIEKLSLLVTSGIMKNIENLFDNAPKMLPNFILSFHLSSELWLRNLLKKSGLSFKEYLSVLDDLYRYRLIENKNTIFWCENWALS